MTDRPRPVAPLAVQRRQSRRADCTNQAHANGCAMETPYRSTLRLYFFYF
jgi:hypothetical protein